MFPGAWKDIRLLVPMSFAMSVPYIFLALYRCLSSLAFFNLGQIGVNPSLGVFPSSSFFTSVCHFPYAFPGALCRTYISVFSRPRMENLSVGKPSP